MVTLLNNVFGDTGSAEYPVPNARDIGGYEIFSHGASGEAHALAHRMSDSGQPELGHRLLGEWLAGRSGHGSDWVHLHFHMAIFELAVGEWQGANERFLTEVLPVAATTPDALTDGPALLWRIAMGAPEPVALPWEPLRRTALACMRESDTPFVQIHHLLALAGAGDSDSIVCWLQSDQVARKSQFEPIVEPFGRALIALASRAYGQAAGLLNAALPALNRVGGSHAQNQLFEQLAVWAERQEHKASSKPAYLNAA